MKAIRLFVQVIMQSVMSTEIIDFGVSDYEDTLALQTDIFEELKRQKSTGEEEKEYILIGEHHPVITLGRRAKSENLLASDSFLQTKGIKVFRIGRGGDITYHSPGQLIMYPILDLEKHSLGVKDFVHIMEETVIRLLNKYGIKGERVDGATGVWIGKGGSQERKICAMGIKCSRFCTMHGLALNVNTDLTGFNMINPCGFQDKGVTSLKKELGKEIEMEKIKEEILNIFLGLIFPLEEVFHFSK